MLELGEQRPQHRRVPEFTGVPQVLGDDRIALIVWKRVGGRLDQVAITAPGLGLIPQLASFAAVTKHDDARESGGRACGAVRVVAKDRDSWPAPLGRLCA